MLHTICGLQLLKNIEILEFYGFCGLNVHVETRHRFPQTVVYLRLSVGVLSDGILPPQKKYAKFNSSLIDYLL